MKKAGESPGIRKKEGRKKKKNACANILQPICLTGVMSELPWHCCCKMFTYTLTGKDHYDAVIQVIMLVPSPPNYVQLCIIRRSNRAPPNEIFLCVQGCPQSALAQLSEKNTKEQNLKVQTVLQLRCGGLVSTAPLTNSLGASSKFVSLGVYFFFPSFSSFFRGSQESGQLLTPGPAARRPPNMQERAGA